MTTIAAEPRSNTEGPEPFQRRWSRDEYYRLAEQGYFDGQRVELIEGRILQMPAQGVPHTLAVEKIGEYARAAFPAGHRFRGQMPLHAADGSDPEPDLAVVPGTLKDAIQSHPTWAVLVVEVSDTSLRHDRQKAALYALTNITDYWILNLLDGTLEVYRQPIVQPSENSPAYASVRVLQRDDTIAPLGSPNAIVKVSDLLP